MAGKQNCWEFKKCGREGGGNKVSELGWCKVSFATSANGLNEGINGGRVCWVINENYYCHQCEFHDKVIQEEGFFISCKAVGTYFINLHILGSEKGQRNGNEIAGAS